MPAFRKDERAALSLPEEERETPKTEGYSGDQATAEREGKRQYLELYGLYE